MQKPQFVENQIYHIYNRGVEKRNIFLDKQDYLRFIHSLFEFNNENTTINTLFHFNSQAMETEPHYLEKGRKPRKLLVEILIFTLMPNHFHLVLKQKKEKGIIKFMQKLGTGYTMYFNKKYKRVGGLFQGRFKAVLVKDESHFIHLPFYIHTNPLELKTKKPPHYRGSTSIMGSLEKYRWSSFLDYIGIKNFPSVTSRELFLEFFNGQEQYKNATYEWLKNKEEGEKEIKEIKID
ncbi:MAG: transposase [Candidatus Pacebacteria bacterium]|nr:transposase [Candidatus Paceibacterota bacterium]